eukprot:3942905-Alexandrium_andersonii.AAC.1
MSASLVGSEMCIRDSYTRPRPGGSASFCARNPMVTTKLAGGCAGGDSRAVSYTHLTLPTICSV